MDVSIILPSFNEMNNIKNGVLEKVYSYLEKQSYTWELLLSDDGSTDGTQEVLDTFVATHTRVTVIHNRHKGKGPTVIAGLLAAKGKFSLFSDFDQATPLWEIDKLLIEAKKGNDIVIGSREGKGATRQKEPFHRHLMGRVFNLIVQLIAIPGVQDTQCGFKLFTHKVVKTLSPLISVYDGREDRNDSFTGAFDVELLYIARKYKYRIAEVPVEWKHVKTDRVDPLKDSLRMFKDLLRIRYADMTGKYQLQK